MHPVAKTEISFSNLNYLEKINRYLFSHENIHKCEKNTHEPDENTYEHEKNMRLKILAHIF